MPSLGNDLASIRKELNQSIADIHKTTKIPVEILEAIENDSIFDKMEENKTYIRSYVRSYARTLKIDDKLIVRALDQIEADGYKGIISDSKKEKIQDNTSDKEPKENIPPQDSSPNAEDMIHDHSPEFSSAESSEKSSQAPKKSTPNTITKPPSVQSVDWADMGRRFTPMKNRPRIWIGGIVLLILLGAIFLIIWFQQGNSRPFSDQSSPANLGTTQEAVDSDSLQLNLSDPTEEGTPSQAVTEQPAESLPDTLILGIYAAYDKLEPVRVHSDVMDSLNPYWIEQGTVFEFEFINEIELRGQFSRMVLLFNGHTIDDFRQRFLNPQRGFVEINRSDFEDDPQWLQPPPDSLGPDIPQPETVQIRPTYQ